MGSEEFKEVFISEAREYLDKLNSSLLDLEKDDSDKDVINEIFRSCHTLKGNAATMGYNKFSELAHDMENLLDKVRNGQLHVDSDMIDVLFEACDLLEEGLTAIKNDEADSIDTKEVIDKLANINPKDEHKTLDYTITEKAHLTDDEKKKAVEEGKKLGNVYRIIVAFDICEPLKGAKSTILFSKIQKAGELIKSYPSADDVKAGKFNYEYEIVFATDKSKEDVEGLKKGVAKIKDFLVLGLDDSYESKYKDLKPEGAKTSSSTPSSAPETASGSASSGSSQESSSSASKEKRVVKEIQDVRIDIKRLDHLMNMVGELLIYKMRLQDIAMKHQMKDLSLIVKNLDVLTSQIQDEVIDERMLPVGQVFNRFPRMVRDVAKKQNKEIDFVTTGNEIRLDRTVLDKIGDPLVHLLRNSVDHGIESAEERVNAGKPAKGVVSLNARREKNYVLIEVIDDGAGIDPVKVKESAIKKGFMKAEEFDGMSDIQIQKLIFKAGFSTNTVVTDISGRGVGMDVVETTMKEVGGTLSMQSFVGKGTRISLQLPLTMAIINSLLIDVKGETYAVPLNAVNKTVDITQNDVKTIQGKEVFILRETEIPLIWLHDLVAKDRSTVDTFVVIIVESVSGQVGLVVDEIIGQQQILIKSLDDSVKKTKGIAGATILGNGNVCLILDIGTLI